ncbi:2OG-Fe(II) oxygenase superfamily protein [Aureococcus anophagefferens]|uniref:2OG-Fe(II) oxygenase superfamily protein n=1 Tax=Aureococcus anophagefferens TaxID=44056 RepID=A0ABR1FVJ7_AURAN
MTDAPPLLTWRRGGGAALLEEIDALVANHCDAHACALRSFGDSSDKAHRAWYLQREAVASGFADRLWACCAACDAWGVTARGGEALRRALPAAAMPRDFGALLTEGGALGSTTTARRC